jgi:hypothetical protein
MDVQGTSVLNWVALSPDGRNLYASARDSSSLVSFARDPNTGGLTSMGCLSGGSDGTGRDGRCAPARGILGPQFVTVSGDGRFVYETSASANSIAIFNRGPGGAVTQVAAPTGCLGDFVDGSDDCVSGPGLKEVFGFALEPRGRHAYTGSYGTGAVNAFRRDPGSGAMTFLGPCFAQQDPLCRPLTPLRRAGFLQVSRDGRHVYLNAPDSSAVHVFARKADTPGVVVLDRRLPVRGGALRPRIRCPRDAELGCFGELRVRAIGPSGTPVDPGTTLPYDFPGRRRPIRVRIPLDARTQAAFAATSIDAVRIEITSREPAGGAYTAGFVVRVTGA